MYVLICIVNTCAQGQTNLCSTCVAINLVPRPASYSVIIFGMKLRNLLIQIKCIGHSMTCFAGKNGGIIRLRLRHHLALGFLDWAPAWDVGGLADWLGIQGYETVGIGFWVERMDFISSVTAEYIIIYYIILVSNYYCNICNIDIW